MYVQWWRTVGTPSLTILPQMLTAQTCGLVHPKEPQHLLNRLSMGIVHPCGQKVSPHCTCAMTSCFMDPLKILLKGDLCLK